MNTRSEGLAPLLDHLLPLRDAFSGQLREKQAQIAVLSAEIEGLKRKLAALAELLPPDSSARAPAAEATSGAEYAGLGPRDAILAHLRLNRRYFGPAELLKALRKKAFATSARQPSGLIRCYLERMERGGILEKYGTRRHVKYRLKQEATGVVAPSLQAQETRP